MDRAAPFVVDHEDLGVVSAVAQVDQAAPVARRGGVKEAGRRVGLRTAERARPKVLGGKDHRAARLIHRAVDRVAARTTVRAARTTSRPNSNPKRTSRAMLMSAEEGCFAAAVDQRVDF